MWGPEGIKLFHCEEINKYVNCSYIPKIPVVCHSTPTTHTHERPHLLFSFRDTIEQDASLQMCRLMSEFSYDLAEHPFVPGRVHRSLRLSC